MIRAKRSVVGIGVLALALLSLASPLLAEPRPRPPRPRTLGLPSVVQPPLDRKLIPAPGPPPTVELPSPVRLRLRCGAELLVSERHTLPMVGVAVVWRRWAAADPAGKEGLASLTASLLDEGTERRGPLELATALSGLGTTLEAQAGWDSTAVAVVSLARHLDASLELLAEVVLHPALSDKEFARVRADLIAATQQRRDAAPVVASDAFAGALYGGARMGVPATGTVESLGRITRDDVVALQRGQLTIGSALIVAAGDVSAEALRARLDQLLGPPPPDVAAPAPLAPPAAAPLPSPRRLLIDKPGAPQSELRLGLPGPPRLTPDYFALLVMNEILGGGDFSNRLNLNLREAHAYTYGAHSGFAFHAGGGPFVVATAARTQVTGPALGEALGELARIRDTEVGADELRFAKDSLERSLARRFETLSDLIFEQANREVLGLPADYFATFRERVEAITIADVQRVARQYLDPSRLSIVVVGDRATVGPQLGAIAARAGAFETAAAGPAPGDPKGASSATGATAPSAGKPPSPSPSSPPRKSR